MSPGPIGEYTKRIAGHLANLSNSGQVAAFASGYLAMLGLFGILRRGQFRWFAPYVWGLAAWTLFTLR